MTSPTFKPVAAAELPAALDIELAGYPADEAASLDSFKFRQSQAPDLFLGAYINDELVGYICSTLSTTEILTHESMSNHVAGSSSVCIHSVCVASKYRRNGIALALLKEYNSRLEGKYERVLLIAHEELRPLYEKAGFEWLGLSQVSHGTRPWFDMRRILPVPAMPAGIWEALQRPAKSKPKAMLLASFAAGISDVSVSNKGSLVNKHDLLCPRPECGSVILKNNVATFVEAPSVQMQPSGLPEHALLPTLPTPPEVTQWWLIKPSPMAFENIGFSKPVASLSRASGKQLKLLACAECDLGPLGWSEEGGFEFWLSCHRVGYRT